MCCWCFVWVSHIQLFLLVYPNIWYQSASNKRMASMDQYAAERLQQVVLAHHLVVSSNFKLISLVVKPKENGKVVLSDGTREGTPSAIPMH